MTNTSNKKKKKRGVSIKACIVMLAVVMLLGCAIGSTVAWLTAKTSEVTNTFTYGDINIDLFEHVYDATENKLTDKETREGVSGYKIIPGVDLPKDPKVIVKAGSEKCWLFIEVNEPNGFVEEKVTYELNLPTTGEDSWTRGTGEDGVPTNVYYKEIDVSEETEDYELYLLKGKGDAELKNGCVEVAQTLTKTDIDTITESNITMSFKAYAIQRASFETAKAAWTEASKTTTNP